MPKRVFLFACLPSRVTEHYPSDVGGDEQGHDAQNELESQSMSRVLLGVFGTMDQLDVAIRTSEVHVSWRRPREQAARAAATEDQDGTCVPTRTSPFTPRLDA